MFKNLDRRGLILKNDHQWRFMFISRAQIGASTRGMSLPSCLWAWANMSSSRDCWPAWPQSCWVFCLMGIGLRSILGFRKGRVGITVLWGRHARLSRRGSCHLAVPRACEILRNCACADGQGSGTTDSRFEAYSCSSSKELLGAELCPLPRFLCLSPNP